MLPSQSRFLNYVDQVAPLIEGLYLSEEVASSLRLTMLREAIETTELVIPIVGSFSAGKSTLLNSFLGKFYLLVGISPETSLAAELRYSQDEYIEAVLADSSVERFSIDDMEAVKLRVNSYSYIRVFVNSPALQRIQPLVLVDMPGFESPVDQHNKAIMEYLSRGVHYVVLTSVEAGTITRSMMRHLQDIQAIGRGFSFFLSKANLRSENDVDDVRNSIVSQLEDHLDFITAVTPIGDDGGMNLEIIVQQLNADALFRELFIETLQEHYFKTDGAINTAIAVLNTSREEQQDTLNTLSQSLHKLESERQAMIEDLQDKHSEGNIRKITNNIEKALRYNFEELIDAATSGGAETLSKSISDIVYSELLISLKAAMSEVGNDVVDAISQKIVLMDSGYSALSLGNEWSGKLSEGIKKSLGTAGKVLNDLLKTTTSPKNTILSTILLTTTRVLNPLVNILFAFLPQILEGLLSKYAEKKKREAIAEQLQEKIIPSVCRELERKLPPLYHEQLATLINVATEKFSDAIQEKQEQIQSEQIVLTSQRESIEQRLAHLKAVQSQINTVANSILFS